MAIKKSTIAVHNITLSHFQAGSEKYPVRVGFIPGAGQVLYKSGVWRVEFPDNQPQPYFINRWGEMTVSMGKWGC